MSSFDWLRINTTPLAISPRDSRILRTGGSEKAGVEDPLLV